MAVLPQNPKGALHLPPHPQPHLQVAKYIDAFQQAKEAAKPAEEAPAEGGDAPMEQ